MLSLKQTAHAAIKSFAANAPWGVRRALFEGIADREGRNTLLSQLALDANISAFMAEGKSGRIESSSSDATVIMGYARTGKWAEGAMAHLRPVLANGGTYLDIGANIGLTTITFAHDERVRCYAFEPEPVNFGHLSANIKRNCPHNNVELIQAAVMEKAGSLTFGLSGEGNPGDHRVVTGGTTRQTITVPGIALDDFLSSVTEPLAVKIDTQGAEPFVIKGGKRTLWNASAVVMEYWPHGIGLLGGTPQPIFDLVRQFRSVQLATGENDGKRPIGSGDQAVHELARLFDTAKHDVYQYWDIYLAR